MWLLQRRHGPRARAGRDELAAPGAQHRAAGEGRVRALSRGQSERARNPGAGTRMAAWAAGGTAGTEGGPLLVRRGDDGNVMNLPVRRYVPIEEPEALVDAWGIQPVETLWDRFNYLAGFTEPRMFDR